MIRSILAAGGDALALNGRSETPAQVAERFYNLDCKAILLQAAGPCGVLRVFVTACGIVLYRFVDWFVCL